MNFYQQKAAAKFKDHVGLDSAKARLLDWAVGLGGETGEVLELIKHHVYGGEVIDKMDLVKELGDVLWYLSAIAESSGVDLNDVMDLNLAKLDHRYHAGRYSNKASASRHNREQLFTQTPIYQIIESRVMNTFPRPINVILVGPDGAGKTTIARKLAELTGLEYHKCDYRQDDKMALAADLMHTETNKLYDRFYIPDDLVYSNLHGNKLDSAWYRDFTEVCALMRKSNVIFIYVAADLATLEQRSSAWQDDYISTQQLEALCEEYQRVFVEYLDDDFLTLKIDTTGLLPNSDDFNDMLTECIGFIDDARYTQLLDLQPQGENDVY